MADGMRQRPGRHVRALTQRTEQAFQADSAARQAQAAEIRALLPAMTAWADALEAGDIDGATEAMRAFYPFALTIVGSIEMSRRLLARERRHDAQDN